MPKEINDLLVQAKFAALRAKAAADARGGFPESIIDSKTLFPHPVCGKAEERLRIVIDRATPRGKKLFGSDNRLAGIVVRRIVKGMHIWDPDAPSECKLPVMIKNPQKLAERDLGYEAGRKNALVPYYDGTRWRFYWGRVVKRRVQVMRPALLDDDLRERFIRWLQDIFSPPR